MNSMRTTNQRDLDSDVSAFLATIDTNRANMKGANLMSSPVGTIARPDHSLARRLRTFALALTVAAGTLSVPATQALASDNYAPPNPDARCWAGRPGDIEFFLPG